jgi:PAS domain S-box-containing protein
MTRASCSAVWQQQLGLLLESTGEGIFGIDLAGCCVFINRAGAQMLGWEPAEMLGHNMHTLTHHSHADGSATTRTRLPDLQRLPPGPALPHRHRGVLAPDGTRVRGRILQPPDHGRRCRCAGAVITFVDITERTPGRSAGELRRANDELELRVAERTRELSAALAQLRELAAWSEKCAKRNAPASPARCTTSSAACWWP